MTDRRASNMGEHASRGASAAPCVECGDTPADGFGCRERFEALLAFEAERPRVFAAVHHLTVATYFLQHPSGYSAEVLLAWRTLIDDALSGRARPVDLQRRNARQFRGAHRVRDDTAVVPRTWPRRWTLAVSDVFNPNAPPAPDDYIAGARAWAAATIRTLDAAVGPVGQRS